MSKRTVVNFTPRNVTPDNPLQDGNNPGSFDEAAERCALVLDMSRVRDDIEKLAERLFMSFSFSIKETRHINDHLMDAKKSIAAAVGSMPTRS